MARQRRETHHRRIAVLFSDGSMSVAPSDDSKSIRMAREEMDSWNGREAPNSPALARLAFIRIEITQVLDHG